MHIKILRWTTIVLVAIVVSGCASPALVDNMTAPRNPRLENAQSSPFLKNMRVESIYGGSETNPLWTSQVSSPAFEGALRNSLQANGLMIKSIPDPRFEVIATLSKLDQPFIGLDMTVTSDVHYEVIESKTRKSWFDEKIQAAYTATFGDAPMAIKRLRLANEGSIRENIRIFIDKILQLSGPAETAPKR